MRSSDRCVEHRLVERAPRARSGDPTPESAERTTERGIAEFRVARRWIHVTARRSGRGVRRRSRKIAHASAMSGSIASSSASSRGRYVDAEVAETRLSRQQREPHAIRIRSSAVFRPRPLHRDAYSSPTATSRTNRHV